ncbi:MAG: UDP-N-acetylmuramate dehydrogenase [Bacteroidaceae bacterium]|nr:UDP-N-acetylmuramate dehydrogenase [Bacteroidaceae bacterium]
MKIFDNCPLKERHTFGMDVKADRLIEFASEDELKSALTDAVKPLLFMGGGSNLLFLNDYRGTILHSTIDSIEVTAEDSTSVTVRAGSGVVWDDFVACCVEQGWWGVENLSLIPGEVGASAVQNIGAYGVEVKDVLQSIEAISVDDLSRRVFTNAECNYAYRDSIFKNILKGKYVITYVTYRLSKTATPNIGYGALKSVLPENPSLKEIRDAIIAVRNSKLPDPKVYGNAGSFFMNPVIPMEQFVELQSRYPEIPSYPASEGYIKVPAGWLIEKSGWKGKSVGNAAVYEKQALVLVNRGGATGMEIKHLADTVIEDVRKMFGITLHAEVNYIG